MLDRLTGPGQVRPRTCVSEAVAAGKITREQARQHLPAPKDLNQSLGAIFLPKGASTAEPAKIGTLVSSLKLALEEARRRRSLQKETPGTEPDGKESPSEPSNRKGRHFEEFVGGGNEHVPSD